MILDEKREILVGNKAEKILLIFEKEKHSFSCEGIFLSIECTVLCLGTKF